MCNLAYVKKKLYLCTLNEKRPLSVLSDMKFRALPIVAILFIAAAMIVQFVISFSLEKEHVRETVEYKMQLAQKDWPSLINEPQELQYIKRFSFSCY